MEFSIILLSSGVVAAVVSGVVTAVMQKHNERESRLFQAKLEAYKSFIAHLESRFVSLTKENTDLDLPTLMGIGANCLLVCDQDLNRQLKSFLGVVSKVFKKCEEDADTPEDFEKIWEEGEKIEELMRKDLGLK